jgi:hypothetical protein
MTKPIIKIYDIETDEVIEREMTVAEFKQYETDKAEALKLAKVEADKLSKKAALLEKLGITEDEAKLLLA